MSVFAEEQVDLTSPFDPDTRTTSIFTVKELHLFRGDTDENALIQIGLEGNDIKASFTIDGTDAATLMKTLNKADLTTNTLNKRVLNYLISQGIISGTVSGNPE